MPSNLVYETVLDKEGFLWVATDNGISRFDGKRFVNYNTKSGLPSNDVIQVIKQKDGTIWANCYKQPPSYFDIKLNKFICLDTNDEVIEICKNLILYHDEIDDKGLFFQNNQGYFFIKNRKIELIEKVSLSKNKKSIYNLYFENKFQSFETHTFKEKETTTLQLTHLKNKEQNAVIEISEKNRIFTVCYKKEAIYVFTYSSFEKLNNFKTTPFSYKSKKIQIPKTIKWYEFSNGKISIICVDGTVYFYDEKTLQLEQTIRTNSNVNTASIDLSKNIWISTHNNGLLFYSLSNIQQVAFPENQDTNFFSIKAFEDNTFYAGTFKGEILKKQQNNSTKYFFENQKPSDNWVKNILNFPNKIIAVSDYGLNINFNRNIKIYSTIGQFTYLKSSLKVNDSILILGSISGVYKFNVANEKGKFLKIPSQRINHLKQKNENSFYFTANDGLFEYDLITDKYKIVFSNSNLKNDAIHLFEVANNTKIWISTFKGNLYLVENGKIIKDYSNNDQIPINIIELLQQDELLWIASKEGIYSLNLKSNSKNKITKITKSDGLISNYINDLEFYGDTIFAATDLGISKIPIHNFSSKFSLVPKIVSIKINGKTRPITSKFNLSNAETNIALEIAGVDVTGHFKHLEYQLNENNFVRIDGNFLNLQLKNGTNNIKIRAVDLNNKIHPKSIFLQFKIATPFYKTIWFWIMISFLFTSLVLYLINKRKLNQQSLKFQQQLALEKQRNQITADLHDDIGATLSSLQLNSAVANHLIRKDIGKASQMLDKIENQSKDLADKIGDIIWSMKPGKNEFMTLSNRIKNFASDIFGATNCNYVIQIDEEIDKIITDITIRKNIILITKEAINNCAKYSQAKNVIISIKKNNHIIELFINDDGIGFDSSIIKGNGIQNIQQRAKEINAVIEIISNKNEGTQIKLQLSYP